MTDESTAPDSAAASDAERLAPQIDRIVAAVTERVERQRCPASTYRLQFNAGFTFQHAREIVPYLSQLGISDVYASPILHARKGSLHGYDVVAHHEFGPDLGTQEDFNAFSAALQQAGLGLILDIVPNHMAASPVENAWWRDVLENGPSSPYAMFFDIDWAPLKADLVNKLLLPVLGDQYGRVLERGELQVCYGDGSFWLEYYQNTFPLAPRSYEFLLSPGLEQLEQELGHDHPDVIELLSIRTALQNLPPFTETSPERVAERQREKEVIKRRLRTLTSESPRIAQFVEDNVRAVNGSNGDPRSFDRLDDLLQQQAYRLAYWRVAADEINYRRFFDVNELAAICVERPPVFDAVHQFVFELLDAGQVTGLRIDHPDGLFDPPGYLRKLQEHWYLHLAREAAGSSEEWQQLEPEVRRLWDTAALLPGSPMSRPLFVVVEKILERDEQIPADWLAHGTVGYEFLTALSGVLVNPAGAKLCTTTYQRQTGDNFDPHELAYRCKRLIVRRSMSSELTVLSHRLDQISERNRWTRDFTLNSLAHALEEVISCFEVYRTYVRPERLLERDRRYIEQAVARAKRRNPTFSASIFNFLQGLLLLQFEDTAAEDERQAVIEFVGKFQQLTGPIMAKAIEDTAFYRFNRLVSLNEVGGDPQQFGTPRDTFHKLNASRLPQWSRGLLGTSTHDTKRSEDVRARIAVLSEVARDWRTHVTRWMRQNARHKTDVDGQPSPSRNDEFLLYQTLIGVWPGLNGELDTLLERMKQYMLKVAREAKLHTSWTNPNDAYERAVTSFLERLFQHRGPRSFLASLDAFARKIAEHGTWNSLSQVALKLAAPGVADFYQGTELWTLTLVDPDNRQPVHFEQRRAILKDLATRWNDEAGRQSLLAELLETRADGRLKLFTIWRGVQLRRQMPELFTDGEYLPLETVGRFSDHVVTFARKFRDRSAIVIAPRWTVDICGFGGPPPLGEQWEDTAVVLPESFPATWTNACSDERLTIAEGRLDVAHVLRNWPVAMLLG